MRNSTQETRSRLPFASESDGGPIGPLAGLMLGAVTTGVVIPIATSWSLPWVIFGIAVGALIGGAIGYWAKRPTG